MKLELPDFLINTNYEDAKLDYKWNNSIEDKITTVAPEKVIEIVVKLNHKAQMGLATACSELIFWRLHNFGEKEGLDLSDYITFVEAAWASLISKEYLSVQMSSFPYETNKAQVVLYNTDALFRPVAKRYTNGSYFTYELVANMVAIAKHISPDKDLFDAWLIDCLKRSEALFPAQYDVDDIIFERPTYKKMIYDSSSEPAIPREFYFTPDFDYKSADIAALNQAYLEQLDYQNNPYLNSPEVMIGKGFTGTPYKV